MPESVLRCPGCGAPANTADAACAYCGCALATVTCPSCFAPIFQGSRFCPHCGVEATRDVSEDATPLKCPRCREDMEVLKLGETVTRACSACGGLWLDPASLQKLCDTREEHSIIDSTLTTRVPTTNVAPDVVKYIPCPKCEKLMNRVNFAHSSGVIIDVCKHDGVWLDRGELQRVITFVESGGLTIARERQREQLEDEQRRLIALQTRSQSFGGMTREVPSTMHVGVTWSHTSGLAAGTLGKQLLDTLGIAVRDA